MLPIGIFVIIGYYLHSGEYNMLLNMIWYYLNIYVFSYPLQVGPA